MVANSDDTILIDECPHCRRRHKYALDVERSTIMFPGRGAGGQMAEFHFTRLFTCPDTGKDFQAEIILSEPRGSKIDALRVKGMADDGFRF